MEVRPGETCSHAAELCRELLQRGQRFLVRLVIAVIAIRIIATGIRAILTIAIEALRARALTCRIFGQQELQRAHKASSVLWR